MPSVIFDVGANIGQSALEYTRRYPHARIYSFEPSITNFETLKLNTSHKNNITCFHYALGDKSVTGFLNTKDFTSERFRILESDKGEPVEVRVLDDVFHELQLSRINLLKIDAEGFDMKILLGGENLIKDKKIDMIQVACSMNARNKDHIAFDVFQSYFEQRDYLLYNLYEQTPNWTTGEPYLRRANAVYISSVLNSTNIIDVP